MNLNIAPAPLPIIPNWDNQIEYTISYTTEIITSRSGKEQRRSLREYPAEKLSMQIDAFDGDTKTHLDYLFFNQSNFIPVPNYAKMVSIASATGGAITISGSNYWFKANHYAVIVQGGLLHFSQISSVVGSVVNLQTAPSFTVAPERAYITPCIIAEPLNSQEMSFLTANLFESSVDFTSVRGLEAALSIAAASYFFDGREVLNYSMDWKKNPTLSYKTTIEKNAGEHGVGVYRNMIGYPNYVLGQQLSLFSQIEAFNFENFFRRLKGRKGEFYASNFADDMLIKTISTNSITVSSLAIYNTYRTSKLHKAIVVKTKYGQIYYNKITSYSFSGSDTIINLSTNWSGVFNVSDIDTCSWLYLCRMASDEVTFQWTTSEICDININLQTLENLAVET